MWILCKWHVGDVFNVLIGKPYKIQVKFVLVDWFYLSFCKLGSLQQRLGWFIVDSLWYWWISSYGELATKYRYWYFCCVKNTPQCEFSNRMRLMANASCFPHRLFVCHNPSNVSPSCSIKIAIFPQLRKSNPMSLLPSAY